MRSTCLAIFDIDDTLTDTNAVDDECFLRAAAEVLDLDAARLDWSAAPHVTDAAIAAWLCERHCGRAAAPGELTRMTAIFVDRLRAELAVSPARFAPIAGAVGVLQDLSTAGWTAALATGGWGASARLKLAAAGVDTNGVPLICADDALSWRRVRRTGAPAAGSWRGPGAPRPRRPPRSAEGARASGSPAGG